MGEQERRGKRGREEGRLGEKRRELGEKRGEREKRRKEKKKEKQRERLHDKLGKGFFPYDPKKEKEENKRKYCMLV